MNLVASRAALTVAAVYGFFLLFAQFAFVGIISEAGIGHSGERILLGLMALSGVASGFFAAWRSPSPVLLRAALGVCVIAASIAGTSGIFPAALVSALLTGGGLGVATVALAAFLPGWCGILAVGFGTGIGYAICNIPWIFQETASHQAWIAAVMAAVGAMTVPSFQSWKIQATVPSIPFVAAVVVFAALVWLDSAAFFVIQHDTELKSGTWGDALLWRNSIIHLVFAIAAGSAMAGRRPQSVPVIGWLVLAVAALSVNVDSSRPIASMLYPAGVSLYSVALVVWPGWFSGACDPKRAAWRAAWIFAIAGWFASANGIGMAQSLNRVPASFIAFSGAALLAAMMSSNRFRPRSALTTLTVAAIGMAWPHGDGPENGSAASRGREVYLAEGCIHCHSRYTRPGTSDELLWGPAPTEDGVVVEKPVLIGNRRQGPDLTNIGARRSEAWLKAHFIAPRALVPDSVMPSYAHLFNDGRGDDLVRFLKESGVASTPALLIAREQWTPGVSSLGLDAPHLFKRHCAVCHGADGGGLGPLAAQLGVKPANLRRGPFIRTADTDDPLTAIARVIRFGVIGSDMPGHETLQDSEILALSKMLLEWRESE